MIQCSTYLVFPLLAGLCICARPLIVLLYGDKWVESIPYVMVACFTFSLLPFHTINTNAISAMGRSDVFLLLDCIKKAVGIIVIVVSLRYGVMVFMLSIAFIQSPFAVFVNTFANGRLLGYNLWMQLRDIAPSALLTAVMAAAVVAVRITIHPFLVSIPFESVALAMDLILSTVVGAAVYIGLSLEFKPRPFLEYANLVLPVFRTRLPELARIVERVTK